MTVATTTAADEIIEKVYAGRRISVDEGVVLYNDADLITLGALADFVKRCMHPGDLTTFVIDRNINYTNVCIYDCSFCAFYRKLGEKDAYVLSKEEIFRKVEELVSLGGTQVLLQGGVHPNLEIDFYLDLIRSVKERFPVHVHSFSPVEIEWVARKHSMTVKDVLRAFREAGLDSLPGGGGEILVDRVRDIISPRKKERIWLGVMRDAMEIGMPTTATMVYGMIETPRERLEHIEKIRLLQDDMRALRRRQLENALRDDDAPRGNPDPRDGTVAEFRAFILWSFSPGNTKLDCPASTGAEYLRMVALSRIMLDNVDNLQSGWVTEGPKMAQVALNFGANDMGGVLMEENVVGATGITLKVAVDDMLHMIRAAGKIPAQRNTRYEILKTFN